MALAAALAGGLNAAGSVAGGALARPEEIEPQYSYYIPQTDPVLAGLSLEAMLGLGLDPGIILQQSSPVQNIVNRIQMDPGLTADQKSRASRALANLVAGRSTLEGLGERTRKSLRAGLASAGLSINDIGRLLAQEDQWADYSQGVLENIRGAQGTVFEGRTATQEAIGNLMGELAGYYGGGDSPVIAQFRRMREAEINRAYDERLEDVMRMSNVTGFNPGRAIADLERDRTEQLQNLSFEGTQQLGGILGILQGSLMPAQQTAQAAAGQRTGAGASAAQIAGNQASAINAIQAQTNAQQAQALGAGVAGGFGALGNAATLYGLFRGGPGASPRPPTNQWMAMNPSVIEGMLR